MNRRSRKLTLYTLLTEYRDNLATLTAGFFDGFTVTRATGYYKGMPEPSGRIEVIGEPADWQAIEALATAIRNVNAQQSVYILETDATLTEIADHE